MSNNNLIAIDARWMGHGCRGMGSHAHTLIKPVIGQVLGLAPRCKHKASLTTLNSGPAFYPLWEQLWLPFLCLKNGVNYLVCPYNTAPVLLPMNTRLVLVVHDLIFMSSWSSVPPSPYPWQELGRFYRKLVLPMVIHKAYKIITVSNYSRNQILQSFSLDPERVVVIPNSIEDEWFARDPLPYSMRQPYLLAVSGEAPSKNLLNLIRAFSLLKNRYCAGYASLTLRVVGVKPLAHHRFMSFAKTLGVQHSVIFENYVDQSSLIQMYRHSTLFVLPSLAEGFGIPLIEAMAAGAPIVCSNTTSAPEVAGENCFFFDPFNVHSIVKSLLSALESPLVCQENICLGVKRSHSFRGSVVAESVSQFWKYIL